MEDYPEFTFSDLSETETVDTDYEVDNRTPIERYGFGLSTARAGAIVHMETYTSHNVRNLIPIHHYREAITYALSIRQKTFRNLVITVGHENYMRYISLSRSRLLKYGSDIIEGFSKVLDQIVENNILEIYDNYEESAARTEQMYGVSMDEFGLITGYFSIVYDQPNTPAGGIITNKIYTEYLEIEDIEEDYGPYNCFFVCLSHTLKIKFDPDKCRKIMKISNESGLVAIRNIKRFERAIKVRIIVYEDMIVDNKPSSLYGGSPLYNKTVELVLFNQHYCIYKGIKQAKANEFENYCEDYSKYIFYDFETYMEPHTFIMSPYAMSYCIYKEGKLETSGCLVKTNIEDDFENSIANFFDKYKDQCTIRLVGFNNGAFDDYILIDILTKFNKCLKKTLFDRTSKILSFKMGNIISSDAYRFFMMPLKEATESFECNLRKGYLDHSVVQAHVENDTFNQWINENKNMVEEYAISDVTSLAELYFTADKYFKTINTNLDIKSSLTLSQMSIKAFKAEIAQKKWTLPILNKEQDDIVRKALVGGRCQIFNRCEELEYDIQSIDVVSLYPHIMMNYKYPIVTDKYKHNNWFVKTNRYVSNRFGIYQVQIIEQPKDTIIPDRNKDGTLNWDQHHEFTTWTDSISLECLKQHGGTFKIIEGYYVDLEYHNIYEDYLGPLMKEKLIQDQLGDDCNKAMRSCIKLLMNSLSGKMGQRPITSEKQICDTAEACDRMIAKYKESATVIQIRKRVWLIEGEYKDENVIIKSPTILAVMIYAYARVYMYNNFISKIKYKYGMDTDSLFIRNSEVEILKANGTIGSEFGQARLELPNECKGIYIAKKIYANYGINDKASETVYRLKFKGVNKNDKVIPQHKVESVKSMIQNNEWKKLNELWDELEDAYTLRTLREMLRNKQVYILCSQIRRVFKNKNTFESFIIRGKYIIKKYPNELDMNMIV